jgi:hypothetical protein
LLVDGEAVEQRSLQERRELEERLEREAAAAEQARQDFEKAAKTIEELEAERLVLLAEIQSSSTRLWQPG